jgi:hypothetical protein
VFARRLAVALVAIGFAVAAFGSAAYPVTAPKPRMPNPRRLTKVVILDFNGIRLSPPLTNVGPPVGPSQAWKARLPIADASAYRLVLAQLSSTYPLSPTGPAKHALVWLIFGAHVPASRIGPPGSVKHLRNVFETAMQPVNAKTGQTYGLYEFSSKELADLHQDLSPYR